MSGPVCCLLFHSLRIPFKPREGEDKVLCWPDVTSDCMDEPGTHRHHLANTGNHTLCMCLDRTPDTHMEFFIFATQSGVAVMSGSVIVDNI